MKNIKQYDEYKNIWIYDETNGYVNTENLKIANKLSSGFYKIRLDVNGVPYFLPEKITANNINPHVLMFNELIGEIKTFLSDVENKKLLNKYNVMLYGKSGTGKTRLAKSISKYLIDEHGFICFYIKTYDDLYSIYHYIETFRKVESNRNLLLIYDDLNSIAARGTGGDTQLFNILDSLTEFENCISIGIVNYPEEIDSRLTTNLLRFNKRVYVGELSETSRSEYISSILSENELTKITLSKLMMLTRNFTVSEIDTYLQLLFTFNYDENIASVVISNSRNKLDSLEYGKTNKKMGFK